MDTDAEPWAVRTAGGTITVRFVTEDGTPGTLGLEPAQAAVLALDLHWAVQQATAAGEHPDDLVDVVEPIGEPPARCARRRR